MQAQQAVKVAARRRTGASLPAAEQFRPAAALRLADREVAQQAAWGVGKEI